MKNHFFALALCVTALSTPAAFAQTAKDAAITDAGKEVVSTNGNCVRTRWNSPSDPCAPEVPKKVEAPAPAPAPVPQIALEERTIYFEFNKTALSAEAIAKIDSLVRVIIASKGIQNATVLGYADEIGKTGYNQKLSERRAAAVQGYLATRVTIPTSVLMVAGKGETDSKTTCPESMKRKERIACLAKDRRVEVEFNYAK